MALRTLAIVTEECERTRANWEGRELPESAIDALEARLLHRISKECVEIDDEAFLENQDGDSDAAPSYCQFCGETEADCCGGGGPLAYDPHDFTGGGLSIRELPLIDFDADKDEVGEWNGCSDEEAQRIADTPSVPRFLKSDEDRCDCGQTKGNCGPNF